MNHGRQVTQGDTKSCIKCNNFFDKSHFTKKGARSRYCKSCWNQWVIKGVTRKKNLYVNQLGGKCSQCGYDKYIGALDFHHVDPTKKEMNIRWFSYPKEILEAEIAKCVLLCANCHREIHHKY